MTFYVNQGNTKNLSSEVAKFIAEKLNISTDAALDAMALFFVDKIRSDEYDESEIPRLKELEQVGLGYFTD